MLSEDELIQQLYQTTRIFSKSLNKVLAESEIFGSEWTISKIIEELGGISQLELIERLGTKPAAVSKALKKLEKKIIY